MRNLGKASVALCVYLRVSDSAGGRMARQMCARL